MYKKVYNENGLVSNPITKENPFINVGENRSTRRLKHRKSNNKKGNGLVVVKTGSLSFMKYRIVKDQSRKKLVVHSVAV